MTPRSFSPKQKNSTSPSFTVCLHYIPGVHTSAEVRSVKLKVFFHSKKLLGIEEKFKLRDNVPTVQQCLVQYQTTYCIQTYCVPKFGTLQNILKFFILIKHYLTLEVNYLLVIDTR